MHNPSEQQSPLRATARLEPDAPRRGGAAGRKTSRTHASGPVDGLLDAPDLAETLESERFKQVLDQVPVAIAVSAIRAQERIVYANFEFARLVGREIADLIGGDWNRLCGAAADQDEGRSLGRAVVDGRDYIGTFRIARDDGECVVDAWSNLIEDDEGAPAFRVVALVDAASRKASLLDQLQQRVREKDLQLRELQHRVKNNLQMITALIRVEAQGVSDRTTGEGFDRLAGRVEALGLLYRALSEGGQRSEIDLGIYLSEIAAAVMRAHAVDGIRLDMKVDTWPVSIDVAMPVGLVVNELLTNSLKYAFADSGGGVITLRCTTEGRGCRIVVADDGAGLPQGVVWPQPGKLSALIVRSLRDNAAAEIETHSAPAAGLRVEIALGTGAAR